jgi:hypothetical protein
MRGLIIQSEPINEILADRKTWEIRGKRTHIRGTIGLIEKGTGTVVGVCELVECLGPLSLAEMRRNVEKHGIPLAELRSRKNHYKTIFVGAEEASQAKASSAVSSQILSYHLASIARFNS